MLDFYKKFNYNIFRTLLDSRGCQWLLAACHNTTYRDNFGTVIFVVQGIISRLNKSPNAYSGCSKQPGYRYSTLKRRRKLLKEGCKFDPKIREWVKR